MGRGLEYLNSLQQWQGTMGSDWSLEPMTRLLAAMGNPQVSYRLIHVAGTNGKGSVSVMVAAALGMAGHRVGLTISPHLVRPNERIVLDGRVVTDSELDWAGSEVERCAKGVGGAPSYFEAITAAAFLLFREWKVDWAVVEVGLGGRLDATNVATPEIGAIVSIDLDHEHILGGTRPLIAQEKAGIIKPGMKVVVGGLDPDSASVISRQAERVGATSVVLNDAFSIRGGHGTCIRVNLANGSSVDILPPLLGSHQEHNTAVAAQVASLAGITNEQIRTGIESAFWPARLERMVQLKAPIWIDSAHNPAGIQTCCEFIKDQGFQCVDVVFGALEVKSWQGMVGQLQPFVRTWYLAEPDFPKALPSAILAAHLSGIGVTALDFGRRYDDLLKEVLFDRVEPLFILGSIYLVGQLRAKLRVPDRPLWKQASINEEHRDHGSRKGQKN